MIHPQVPEPKIRKNTLRIAIIGAGRNRNGIGHYIARYFQQTTARVVAVMGTTPDTARKAAAALVPYEIEAAAYSDFATMIRKEQPDAVVIASAMESHHEYLVKCMEAGVHVFCEKPFVWPDDTSTLRDIHGLVDSVFDMAARQGLRIAMNSQWPFSLPCYENLCGPITPQARDSFFVRLSPMASGKKMILDSVPHALSMIYDVFGEGKIEEMRLKTELQKICIGFHYLHSRGMCAVEIDLVHSPRQPRDFSYGFNRKIIHRMLDLDTYEISFAYAETKLKIKDPLALSVQDFVTAVTDDREPRIGQAHIVHNMKLLNEIYDFSQTI